MGVEFRRTKIVATIGPASDAPRTIRALIEAGVDVFRLNFSHGDHAEKGQQIESIREMEREAGRPVAVLQDIQGPKIRVGPIPGGPIRLHANQEIEIYGDGRPGDALAISTNHPELGREVSKGDAIFLDDGSIELRVVDATPERVRCVVVTGGRLSGGKGVNLPGARLSVPALTEKDEEDLRFALPLGVDYVAMSFVRGPHDADAARKVMKDTGFRVPLLAKIEKREAVERLEQVLKAFDGAMVARGDLGVELRPELVPTVQRQIIDGCIELGRPVITATQMLESMTVNLRPTRAEASDVANAVYDGTHAVMLSGETAIGKHPVEVVRAMHRIAVEAERVEQPRSAHRPASPSATYAVCAAAAQLADVIGAEALIAFTRSGRTAMTLSSLQPSRPIIALCDETGMARRLCLWRGVLPVVIGPSPADPTERILAEARRLLPGGGQVVAVGAAPGSRAGQTDFIRLLRL